MLKSVVLGLCVPVVVTLLTVASGCTVTNDTDNPDGGIVTPTGDSGSSGGDSATGTTLPLGFTPSNLGAALAGVDLSKLDDIDVTLASDLLPSDTVGCIHDTNCFSTSILQADGSSITLYAAKSWKVEANAVLNVNGSHGVVLVALNTIEVLGRIDASAQRYTAVAGGFSGGSTSGPGGGTAVVTPSGGSGPGVGAGGGSYCGLGGKGGGGGAPGAAYGGAPIIPLVGGSTGGSGPTPSGGGGGAVQLVAGTSVTIGAGGVLSVNGGGGGYAAASPASGGGTGGALLLEAPVISIAGSLSANGGGGGGAGPGAPNGADGAPGSAPAVGGNAARDPSSGGAAGGKGSGGTATAGTDGDPGNESYTAAAGGGGAGWIRINTRSGAASVSGTLSPSANTTCTTQGTLAP